MKTWIKMSSLCVATGAAVIFCLVYWDVVTPDCNLILAAGFCLGGGFSNFSAMFERQESEKSNK